MDDIRRIAEAIAAGDLTPVRAAMRRRQLFVTSELELQTLCLSVVRSTPLTRRFVRAYSVPNESKMSYQRGRAMRRAGRTSGVCDTQVDSIGGDGFRVEMKMPGNYASDAQRSFIRDCNRTGHRAYLVYTFIEWCRVLMGEYVGKPDTYYQNPDREITKAGNLRNADPHPEDVLTC